MALGHAHSRLENKQSHDLCTKQVYQRYFHHIGYIKIFSPVHCKGEGLKGQIKEHEDKAKGRRWEKVSTSFHTEVTRQNNA